MLNRPPILHIGRRHFCRGAAAFSALTGVGLPGTALAADPPSILWQPSNPTPEAFMARALALAETAVRRGDGTPYGAVIVRGQLVVGEGWNRSRRRTDPTAHAEVEAIQDACRRLKTRDLSGTVLYTNGGRPCPMCETAAYWAGIGRIRYGTSPARITDAGAPKYGGC